MEPEPALEVRRSPLLGVGVDIDQRRVDVQHDLLVGDLLEQPPDRGLTYLHQTSQPLVVDLLHRPPRGRIRCHVTEQQWLVAQRAKIRQAPTTSSDHHRHVREQPAPIMRGRPGRGVGHHRRPARRDTQLIGDPTQQMRTRLAGHVPAVAGHVDARDRSCSVHPQGALRFLTRSSTERTQARRRALSMQPAPDPLQDRG